MQFSNKTHTVQPRTLDSTITTITYHRLEEHSVSKLQEWKQTKLGIKSMKHTLPSSLAVIDRQKAPRLAASLDFFLLPPRSACG